MKNLLIILIFVLVVACAPPMPSGGTTNYYVVQQEPPQQQSRTGNNMTIHEMRKYHLVQRYHYESKETRVYVTVPGIFYDYNNQQRVDMAQPFFNHHPDATVVAFYDEKTGELIGYVPKGDQFKT